MAKQSINVSTPNSGNGDPLRTAFVKINSNFTELYAALGLDVGGLNLGAFQFSGSTMSTTDSTPMVLDQAVSVTGDLTVGGDLLPNSDLQVNLGSPSKKWHSLYVGTGSVYIGDAKLSLEGGTLNSSVGFSTDSLTIAGVALTVNNAGQVEASTGFSLGQVLPADAAGVLTNDGAGILTWGPGGGGSSNQLVNGLYDVTLDVNGNTTFPTQGYIRQSNSYTRTFNGTNISGAPTVIWTGTNDNITSVKMTIQIEGYEGGDTSGWHTQTCEAVIAERYWSNAGTLDPTMSVYGVVHTSVDPLATFTVQRNPTTHFIEVVATPTGTAFGSLTPKVHSVELGTRD